MQKFDASSWELYHGRVPSMRILSKDKQRAKRDSINSYMVGTARKNAKSMRKDPSALEQKMQQFLTVHQINYEFQKILYIKDKKGIIKRYYIADFFIPKKNIIIETDGKFHDNQTDIDNQRTREIQNYCGSYKIIRWRWHDFESITKLRKLLEILK